jgi:hypothetical protein
MAKKSITEQFRDFLRASPAQSNKPMTKGEIATAVGKKKRKAADKQRASKSPAKKKTASKKSKRTKKSKR